MLSFKDFRIVWLKSTLKQIKNFPINDAKKMSDKLDMLLVDPESLDIKKLKGSNNLYRLRSGDYRIVFQVDTPNKEVIIINLGHRKEVYKLIHGLSVLFMMNINM